MTGVARETLRGILHDFPSSSILRDTKVGKSRRRSGCARTRVMAKSLLHPFGSQSAQEPVPDRWKNCKSARVQGDQWRKRPRHFLCEFYKKSTLSTRWTEGLRDPYFTSTSSGTLSFPAVVMTFLTKCLTFSDCSRDTSIQTQS